MLSWYCIWANSLTSRLSLRTQHFVPLSFTPSGTEPGPFLEILWNTNQNPCSQSRVEPNLEAKESMRLTPCTALVLAQVQRNRAKKEASTPLARNSLPWLLFSEPLHNLTFLLHPQELLSLDQKTYLEKEIWSSLSLPSIPVLQITTSKPHQIYFFQYSDQLF